MVRDEAGRAQCRPEAARRGGGQGDIYPGKRAKISPTGCSTPRPSPRTAGRRSPSAWAPAQTGKMWFKRADNRRISNYGHMSGWDQMRARLVGNDDGHAMLVLFSTCVDFIRTVPFLQHDPDRHEDVSDRQRGPRRRRMAAMPACRGRMRRRRKKRSRKTSAATRRSIRAASSPGIGACISGVTRMRSDPATNAEGGRAGSNDVSGYLQQAAATTSRPAHQAAILRPSGPLRAAG